MTYKEAVYAVYVMTDRQAREAMQDENQVLAKMARWRINDSGTWKDIRDAVMPQPQPLERWRSHKIFGKHKATIGEVRQKAEARRVHEDEGRTDARPDSVG